MNVTPHRCLIGPGHLNVFLGAQHSKHRLSRTSLKSAPRVTLDGFIFQWVPEDCVQASLSFSIKLRVLINAQKPLGQTAQPRLFRLCLENQDIRKQIRISGSILSALFTRQYTCMSRPDKASLVPKILLPI